MSFTNYFFPLTRFYKGAVLFINYKKYSILSCRLLMHRASYFISPVLFNVREAVVSKEQFFLPGSKNLTFTTSRWLSVHKTKREAKLNVLHFVLLIISFLLHGFSKGRFFLLTTKSIRFYQLPFVYASRFVSSVLFNSREAVFFKRAHLVSFLFTRQNAKLN